MTGMIHPINDSPSDIFQYMTTKTIHVGISIMTDQQILKIFTFIIASQNKPPVWTKIAILVLLRVHIILKTLSFSKQTWKMVKNIRIANVISARKWCRFELVDQNKWTKQEIATKFADPAMTRKMMKLVK